MKHAKWIIVALTLFFFSSQAIASTPMGEETDSGILADMGDAALTDLSMKWGPGSEIPVYDPVSDSGNKVYFVSNIEPMQVTWKIYNPSFQKIGEDTHTPSLKRQGSWEGSDGKIYQWLFADQWAFTVPAFASKGNWLLSPSYKMADGSIQQGAWTYYPVPVIVDDIFASIFSAPWYVMGAKLPPIFWTLAILWIPGLFILICVIVTRSATGWVRVIKAARDAVRSARAEWKS